MFVILVKGPGMVKDLEFLAARQALHLQKWVKRERETERERERERDRDSVTHS